MASILSRPQCVNPSGAETEILQDNKINTRAADDLVPYVTRSSTTMALTMQHQRVLIIHKEKCQLPVTSQW